MTLQNSTNPEPLFEFLFLDLVYDLGPLNFEFVELGVEGISLRPWLVASTLLGIFLPTDLLIELFSMLFQLVYIPS